MTGTGTRHVALAWSGGKDSLLALEALRQDSAVSLAGLATTFAEPYRRISMHGIREQLADAQASALGLPLTKIWLPWPCDNETYRERFAAALAPLRAHGLDAVAFGDLFLEDVRAFREKQMADLGLMAAFPLWGRATDRLASQFISGGHRAVVVCVDAEQLEPALLGREYDADFLNDLPPAVDPGGENGEFHTFVHAGPLLRQALEFRHGAATVRDGRFHYLDLVPGDDHGPV